MITGLNFLLIIIVAYLLGSVPFGLVLTRLSGGGDIRRIGSGNIGATNVLRTGNRKIACLTLALDAGKGAVAVFLAMHFIDKNMAAIAGLATIIGHCFPIWIRFRGGKGVATYLAVMSALDIRLGLIFAVLWLATAYITRYSSMAALTATLGATVGAYSFANQQIDMSFATPVSMTIMTGLIWVRHHANIGRLLSGQETKIGAKNKSDK